MGAGSNVTERGLITTDIHKISAVEIFKPDMMKRLVNEVTEAALSHVPDISTVKGRKDIASISAQVARSKTLLDGMGKDLVSGIKAQAALIDRERKTMRDAFDALKEEVRKPLTDWEEKEKARVKRALATIDEIESAAMFAGEVTEGFIRYRLQAVMDIVIDPSFLEYTDIAESAKKRTVALLEEKLAAQIQYEKDRAELERLKKAEEERLERERLEKEEDARKIEAERLKKEQEDREEKIRQDAAQKAIEDEKKRAAEREEKLKAEKDKALQEKKEAEEKAARAVEIEREKVRAAKAAADAEENKRLQDKEHRAKVNSEAVRFIKGICGTSQEQAEGIVSAIANSEVPHVKITY